MRYISTHSAGKIRLFLRNLGGHTPKGNLLRAAVPILAAVIVACAPAKAAAAQTSTPAYVMATPTGGILYNAQPVGNQPYNMEPTGSGRYGGMAGAPSSGGSSSASGTVTYKFTWNSTTVAPPTAVLITATVSATSSNRETCNNGLGVTGSGSASGTLYDVIQTSSPSAVTDQGLTISSSNNGQTITVTVAGASASATTIPAQRPNPATPALATVWMTVSAAPSPVALSFIGPPDAAPHSLAVGQLVTAFVTASNMDLTKDKFAWTLPSDGKPFAAYTVPDLTANPPTLGAQQVPLTLPTTSSMNCYFATKGRPQFQCQYTSAYLSKTFNLHGSLTTLEPKINNVDLSCGKMKVMVNLTTPYDSTNPQVPPSTLALYGATYVNEGATNTYGFFKCDTVADPQNFSGGQWGYVQVVTNATATVTGQVSPPAKSGLDKAFPYPEPLNYLPEDVLWLQADGKAIGVFMDQPNIPNLTKAGIFPLTAKYSQTSNLYLFYLPVASAAGASAYVPLELTVWYAKGNCQATALLSPWPPAVDDGSKFDSTQTDPPFPSWTKLAQ